MNPNKKNFHVKQMSSKRRLTKCSDYSEKITTQNLQIETLLKTIRDKDQKINNLRIKSVILEQELTNAKEKLYTIMKENFY